MADVPLQRFTAIAGIISVLLFGATSALIVDLPSISNTPQVWATYASTHRPQLLREVYLWGAGVSATLVFLTGLWSLLRRAMPEATVAATLGLRGGFLTPAVVLAGFAPLLELGYRGGALDPASAKSLADLTLLGVTLSSFPTVISLGAFSYLIARSGAVARWIGWFGLVVAAAHLIAAGSFDQDGIFSPSVFPVFVTPPVYYLWTLVASIALLRRRARGSAPAAAERPGARVAAN
jgi:hypothetical protein